MTWLVVVMVVVVMMSLTVSPVHLVWPCGLYHISLFGLAGMAGGGPARYR